MIDALKNGVKTAETPAANATAHERAIRLAAGVLLFEIVRADGRITDSESTVIRASLQSTFGLA